MKKITPKIKGLQEKQKRHTHRTAAALEDVIAVMMDIIRVITEVLEYVKARAQSAQEMLREARRGPHSYDPDKPSGTKRFVITKKR